MRVHITARLAFVLLALFKTQSAPGGQTSERKNYKQKSTVYLSKHKCIYILYKNTQTYINIYIL